MSLRAEWEARTGALYAQASGKRSKATSRQQCTPYECKNDQLGSSLLCQVRVPWRKKRKIFGRKRRIHKKKGEKLLAVEGAEWRIGSVVAVTKHRTFAVQPTTKQSNLLEFQCVVSVLVSYAPENTRHIATARAAENAARRSPLAE